MTRMRRVIPLLEVYKCQKCQKEFKGIPGLHICPFCSNNYVVWLTFETDWTYDEVVKQWKRKKN